MQLTVDRDMPTLMIQVPADGSSIPGNAITVGGISEDTTSSPYRVYVALVQGLQPAPSGSEVWELADGNSSWSLSLDLSPYPQGAFTLFAYAQDVASNESAVERVVFYADESDPAVTIDEGTSKAYKTGSFSLTGTIADTNELASFIIESSRDGGVFITEPGYPDTVFTDVNTEAWTYSKTVDSGGGDDGVYDYRFTVFDISGKSRTVTKQIVIDSQPPELDVVNLADGDSVEDAAFTIRGTAIDTSGVALVEYNLNGGGWNPVTGLISWSQQVTGLTEGAANNISFRATDTNGLVNSSLPAINFGLDTSNPSLVISNKGVYNATWQNSSVTLSGSAQDANGISLVEFSKDGGGTWSTIPGATSTDGTEVFWNALITIPPDGSEDGNHTVQIRARDSYAKITMDSLVINFDATAPSINSLNVADNTLVTANPFNLSGTWSDNRIGGNTGGFSRVEYKLDTENVWTLFPTLTAAAFSGSLENMERLDETITLRATDALGNLSAEIPFTGVDFDYAPPQLVETVIGTPSLSIHGSDTLLGGTVLDNNGIASLTLSVNGGAPQMLSVDTDGPDGFPGTGDDGAWSYTLGSASEGLFSLLFTATDGAGRISTLTREISIDTTVPTVSVNNIAADGSTRLGTDSFTVIGTATDTGSGVSLVEYSLNYTNDGDDTNDSWSEALGSSSWTVSLTGLVDGFAQTFAVRSVDRAGKISIVSDLNFDVDLAPPVLTETSSGITGITFGYRSTDTVLGGVATDGNGISSVVVTYAKNGGTAVTLLNDITDDGLWSTSLGTALGDGAYEVVITAADAAGKTSGILRNIVIDTMSPDLTVTSPVDSEFIDVPSYTIRGQVTDNGGKGVSLLQYSLDYSDNGDDTDDTWIDIPLSGFNWSVAGVDFSLTGEGPKALTVRAGDGLNLPNIETVIFNYDSAAPVLTETLVGSTAQEVSSAAISLGGFATDTNALASLHVRTNGGAAQLLSVDADGDDNIPGTGDDGSWSYSQPGTVEGLYTLQFIAADAAGRTTTLMRNLIIDTSAPVVSIELPAGGSYVSGSTYTARGTVAEENNIDAVEYQVDSTGWLPVFGLENWTQALDLIALGAGDHTLEIRATDEAGNSHTASRPFRVDLANPGIIEDGLGSSTGFRNSLFTLSGTVTDDVDVAGITITESKDGGAASTIYSDTFTGSDDVSQFWNLTNLPSGGLSTGQFDYTVTVTDSAGKSSSLTRTVTIDTDAPNVEITSLLPLLSGNRVNGIVTLAVNASDANGLTGVKYFTRTSPGTPEYIDGDGFLMNAPYTVTIDTVNDLIDGQVYFLYVIGRDKAGNDSVSSFSFTVDQDSDVPEGSIDSPLDGTSLGADNRVRGTFRDDDGVASGGAVLYIRKTGAGSYTPKGIPTASSAGQLVAWTVDVSDVTAAGDGIYEFYLSVTDNAASKAGLPAETADTAGQTFFYDQNVPTVSVVTVTPLRTAYAAGDVLTFRWTASDASGLSSQTVDVDGVSTGLGSVVNTSGDNYEVSYTVPGSGILSGTKTFTLVAEDGTGKTASRTLVFTVDVDAPEVENGFTVNPAFIGFTPNGAFELRGVASDNRGLAEVQVTLSGDSGVSYGSWIPALINSGNWTYAVADSSVYVPVAGDLYFKVRALDEAGNYSVLERTFTQAVDQSADKPVVTVISPVDGSSYGTTVQISGTAADDDNLADLDNNGVLDTGAVEVQYDTVPSGGGWTSVNPAITGTGKNANWNYSLVGLAGGNYQVRVRAQDDGAVWGDWSPTAQFTVNAGAPNLVVSTALNAFRSNATLNLAGTVEDSDGVVDVRVRVNGGAWSTVNAGSGSWGVSNTSDTWSYTLNLGSDGLKTIEIQAQDASSFIANEQLSTRVDTTAPGGIFDSYFQDDPTGSYIVTTLLNGLVRVTGTVTELNLVDSDPVRIRIAEWNGASEGAEVLSYTAVTGTYVWNYVWDTTALTDGDYLLQLSIVDKAGNTTDTVTKVVTTDQSADIPVITQAFVDAPASGDAGNNVLGTLLKVSGTLSDDDGFDAEAVAIYLDGSAVPLAAANTGGTTATWSYTWASLAQGEHHLILEVTDRNGNVETLGPTYFLVDTANPSLVLTSPSLSAKIKAGTMIISGTASDAGGLDTDALEISLDHTNNTSPLEGLTFTPSVDGGTFSQNVTINSGSLDGTLYINMVLTDRAGKQSAVTRNVTIDTTSPSLSLNSPSPDSYINGLISVTGTADDLSGLADVTLELLDPVTKLPIASISRSSSTLSAWEFPFNAFSYASTTYGLDVNGDGKLWKILFRLSATDNSGNVTELKTGTPADWPALYIDTDGDKPSIGVTQPKNGDKIGGFVSMFGTATDDDGPVMQVEVRIDFNGDGDFSDSRDINNDDGDGNSSTGISLGSDQDILGTIVRVGDSDEPWEDESAWYVVSVSNNSWSQDLNTNNELYASNTGGTGTIILQVRSRDKFGLASEILTRTITLDETFPRIENILPGDQSYQNGTFPLTAQFGDNEILDLSGDSVIGINVNKTGWTYFTAASPELTVNGANNGYDLLYNINTDLYFPGSSGILYVDLYVKDQALYQNQKSYTYYVDNQAPSSSWSDRSGAPDGSNLSNGMITVNGSDRTYIEGNYDDSGAVNGVSHIEIYFVDGSGNIRNIKTPGTWAGTPSTESIEAQTYSLVSNLWTDTTDPAAPLVTHENLGNDYIIKVDRPTEMSSQTLGTDLDGDGYEEYMGIVSGAPRWRAYFDSQYLPDGIIELHYLVYDLAGNYVHRMREVFIANNGPRADRIQIGSDINASGSVADTGDVTEIVDYYYPSGLVDRTDAVKIKNNRLYVNVEGSDTSGTNQGVKQIFVEAYDATGVTYLGQAAVSTVSPANGDYAVTLAVNPGTGIWPVGDYNGATRRADYQLKLIIRDNDDISLSRWVKLSVINPADITPPILTLNSLSQDDQDPAVSHLELRDDNDVGVWAALSAAYGGDDDPKISGTIAFTGTITDENRLVEVRVASENNPTPILALWNGSELESQDTNVFVIDSQSLGESGHFITFTYYWDTSNVAGVAGTNKTISFTAEDAGTNSASPGSQQADVVPFITRIQRNPATYNTYRSRQGWFLLRQGELVNVSGFNLYNSTADTVTFSNTSGTTTAFNLAGGSTAGGFSLAALDASVSSGPVVVTVSGQPSINNINDNSLDYNTESTPSAEYDGSWLWTDDRYVHVWRSDENQTGDNRGYFTDSVDPEYPAMTIDGAGVLYGSWSNYADSEVKYGPNNGNRTIVFSSYDPLEHTDINFGNRVTIAFNANTYGNGTWNITGAGGSYLWDSQAVDGGTNQWSGTPEATSAVYNAESLYHDQKLMQFINQRVVNNGNNIHHSYYDTDTKALKYFYALSGVGENTYGPTFINVDGGFDQDDGVTNIQVSPNYAWNDNHAVVTIHVSVGDTISVGDPVVTLNNGTDVVILSDYTGLVAQILVDPADTDVDSENLIAVLDTSDTRIVDFGGSSRSAAAGEFSAIDVTPGNGYPVIAYYDITGRTVKIARATAVNPDETRWNLQSVMASGDANREFSGKYITMKIDSQGYVHLAFFRNSTGDLIYLKSTNNPVDGATAYTFGESVIIDSIGSVGSWADLTLDNDEPVISYLDSSLVNTFSGIKVAYYDPSFEAEPGDSAGEPDTADGWETMNAALGFEVESVRTSIETDTGTNFWRHAVGYSSSDYFRIGYYVRQD
jgi:hypothetical protein